MKRTPVFTSMSTRSLKGFSIAFLLASVLCACGNKGPLVLPTEPAPDEVAESPSAAATDAGAEADPLPAEQVEPPATTLPTEAPMPIAPEPDDTSDKDPPGDG